LAPLWPVLRESKRKTIQCVLALPDTTFQTSKGDDGMIQFLYIFSISSL